MSERTHVKRLIVCVDAEESEGGATSGATILREIQIAIDRKVVEQIVRYYRATEDGPKILDRLKTRAQPYFEQQIHDIVKEVCEVLEEPRDELFLYGFGRGAFIVRAVAGLLDILHLPKRTSVRYFEKLYQSCLDVYKARHDEDNRNGPKIIEFLRSHSTLSVQIRFVGAFDTVRYTTEGHKHDLSLVSSIHHMRHALALNESRSQLSPEFVEIPKISADLQGRTLIQAWFLGSHKDLGGGTDHDGLSLYALQWILVESIRAGLVIQWNEKEALIDKGNVLSLVFPQYSGDAPKLGGDDEAEWQVKHNNGIEVSLFDLQTVHGSSAEEDHVHGIQITPSNVLYNSHRTVFESKSGLVGYCTNGMELWDDHPSLGFCLLDRYPRFYEQSRFKSLKKSLANYRDQNVHDPEGGIPPWLEGMQLQASGVKAFRILVCGKTGVGKSTLINKVFGVELTEESQSYSQGEHDINQAFASPNHPGLLIHDSRGWQAGSENELDLIAKFLRHRAYQKDPGEALHVIWFCVDSDVSRIEEADKRTFDTIAQYSCNVPVFVVGTKKDKLIAFRKIQLLEKFMEENGNYSESSRLANDEANRLADEQFMALRDELSRIKHYKADGFCCVSKGRSLLPVPKFVIPDTLMLDVTDDTQGIRKLLHSTLELIVDDRVRVFAVAAQVVDVEQKIDSAITECMRLATHAVRTAMVPLPMSGLVGTPTVARILCEHVLQCFGFPKALPEAVEEIMTRVVFSHLKAFMTITLIEFLAVGTVTAGLMVATMGIGGLLGLTSCILAAQPTARMLFKCACDMILILERSFRYRGKYVSVKQIEDAAIYYTSAMTTTFGGKEMLLQKHVHEEVNKLIPLRKVNAGIQLGKLRPGLEDIIYKNRFNKRDSMQPDLTPLSPEIGGREILELDGGSRPVASPVELPAEKSATAVELPAEVPAGATVPLRSSGKKAGMQLSSASDTTTTIDDLLSSDETTSMTQTISGHVESGALDSSSLLKDDGIERVKTDSLLSKSMKAMGTKKMSSRFGLKKSKTSN
ncbi:hypothetical protein EDD37DRAFT_683031 [Exophiala viscosa]|uniref:uncharacterized protein n=1 Tax=Exophiala viscosa TaxID=2486360 RepID=UPI0021965020|nr:hypothetical protein EDD37DRAFT_683031 [Exophiala viscosa]